MSANVFTIGTRGSHRENRTGKRNFFPGFFIRLTHPSLFLSLFVPERRLALTFSLSLTGNVNVRVRSLCYLLSSIRQSIHSSLSTRDARAVVHSLVTACPVAAGLQSWASLRGTRHNWRKEKDRWIFVIVVVLLFSFSGKKCEDLFLSQLFLSFFSERKQVYFSSYRNNCFCVLLWMQWRNM